MTAPALTAPAPLTPEHDLSSFDCGNPTLTLWLKQHALANQYDDASRTYVVCANSNIVVGYYSIATGAVQRQIAPGQIRRNMPDPIPVIVLGRFAVHTAHQDVGLGRALLRDTMLRTLTIAQQVTVKALVVHAISPDVVPFYLKYDFVPSLSDPLLLFLPIRTIASALAPPNRCLTFLHVASNTPR